MGVLAQARKLAPFLAVFYIPFVAFLMALGYWSVRANVPLTSFMREPQAAAESPFYFGIGSMVGGFLWSGAAAVCFFSWRVLRGIVDKRFRWFVLFWGILSTHLLIDDAFQLHEEVYPGWLGIGQKATYLAYGLLFVIGIAIFRDVFLRTEYLLFLIALGLFALSVFVDIATEQIEPALGQWRILLEDGSKLLGIATWLAYFWRTCAEEQLSRIRGWSREFPAT